MGTEVSSNHGIKTIEDYAAKKAEYNQKREKIEINRACNYMFYGTGLGLSCSYGGSAIGYVVSEGLSKLVPDKGKMADKLRVALNGEEGWFGTIKQPWLKYGIMGATGLLFGLAGAYTANNLAEKIKNDEIEKLNKEYEYLQKYAQKYENAVVA